MSDTPKTDEVWGSMHGSGYQMMLLCQKLERELHSNAPSKPRQNSLLARPIRIGIGFYVKASIRMMAKCGLQSAIPALRTNGTQKSTQPSKGTRHEAGCVDSE